MASPAGSPNTSGNYDAQALFKPPNPGAAPRPPFSPPSAYPAPPTSYPTPPLPGAFSYPPATPPFHHHPFLHYPQEQLHRPPAIYPPAVASSHPPSPNPSPNPSPSPNTNPGARLMALLNPSAQLESAVSMPPPSSTPSEFLAPSTAATAMLHPIPSAPPAALVQSAPVRMRSNKLPRGRLLGAGEWAVYDVDSRLPGEIQPPQLEVTPITKYISDPGLVLGRQIAVNRNYICYGLKLGAIRVLNINTALRSLLKGHSQRVTDMAFFAEDVHFLASASIDGRVFVWKIDEGPDTENKPQITGKIVMAVQIVGEGESCHPRICWHSHKQEILFVGIGYWVLKIDINKVGRGKEFLAEEPIKCHVEKLIDGVQIIGKHDGEVTDLSISQWMVTRLASGSKDGTVRIWDDRKMVPLAMFKPHDGHPVNSVAFMTSPHRPDHINLITAGPLSREVKIWASAIEEGWLLPSDSESWHCTQTLDLKSSLEHRTEEAFFNQIVVLPQASLIVIANAKKNAIYAVHVDYGPYPASMHMDYIADFTVAMPILSLTATHDFLPDGEQVVQIYCVQTQAIQQYALDLIQCLPPPTANAGLVKDPLSHVFDTPSLEGSGVPEPSCGITNSSLDGASATSHAVASVSSEATRTNELSASSFEVQPSAPPLMKADADALQVAPPSVPLNMDFAGTLPALKSPEKTEEAPSLGGCETDRSFSEYSDDRKVDSVVPSTFDVPMTKETTPKEESKVAQSDLSMLSNPRMMFKLGGNSTHLITPAEILSGAIPSSEGSRANQRLIEEVKLQNITTGDNIEGSDLEVKVVGEGRSGQQELDSQKVPPDYPDENKEISPETSMADFVVDNECSTLTENSFEEESHPGEDIAIPGSKKHLPSSTVEEVPDDTKNTTEEVTGSAVSAASQSLAADKGKKQKENKRQMLSPSSPSSSPFNSTETLNEPGSSANVPSADATFPQMPAMQEMLNQIMSMQKEMQKQMGVMVAAPVAKEGKRVETMLSRSMEKIIKANADALWARIQEENAKYEKLEKERMQQMTNLITSYVNKDLPTILERALKKELSAIGSTVARAITPVISTTIAESFQRGVGDKTVNQLEKSMSSKLETAVARQIQTQFQSTGKQVLQDSLRSCLESSVVPAFDNSCKVMFEQVENAFQKGMSEHTASAQQQLEAANTPLALTLREAINSASSITQNLTTELIDGQRKLLALVAAGNTKALSPLAMQQSNGSTPGLPEIVGAPLDPTKELSRLISERKYEEAFTMALQRSDVSIVSWLCTQVDLRAICSAVPLPLSQGVLLALLQQLACDLSNETSRKVGWMTDVAVAINPTDPMITMHVRPIFEQVYSMLGHQRALPTTTASEATNIRLLTHVINSVLMTCK
ncbi:WD domain, G-beta repeat domain containing protein [Musa troglodytarum]|uniref:WD domain, G-beta repeat domain containing protein n=1 Tax=Musa troglodytarum TaxID=320322 RepID=A0A9E7JSE4_9LILI|nr:WD domain, G-beta repeat domain containing protein [Musa troglodytarum]